MGGSFREIMAGRHDCIQWLACALARMAVASFQWKRSYWLYRFTPWRNARRERRIASGP
jgi:hypothetical protein